MAPPVLQEARLSTRRLRWVGIIVVVLGLLAGAIFLFERWSQHQFEYREGLRLAAENNFDEAQPLLQRVEERDPQNVEVVRALALGFLHAHQLAEAEPFLDRWCELQPGETEPYRQRFNLRMEQRKIGAAVADAEHILQLKPNDVKIRERLTTLLLLDGRLEEAEKEGLRCFRAEPNNVETWFLLASIYRSQRQNALATELTDQLLRTVPDHKGGLNLRAQLYLDANQPEPAIRLLRQVVRLNSGPDELNGFHELSVALSRAGRDEEAKQVLAEMQQRRAMFFWSKDKSRYENAGLQQWVVETMQAAGKTDEAIRFLTEILERNPHAAAARQLLASCYEKQGRSKGSTEPRPQGRTTP